MLRFPKVACDRCWPKKYITIPEIVPFGESDLNSPDSFQSSDSFSGSNYADSNFGASPQELSLDSELPKGVKVAGRPRAPVASGRDPNENRIQVLEVLHILHFWTNQNQRRRTQNRNSQRVYRQRRIEERNVFEARATAAEDSSAELKNKIVVLETEVAKLTEQVQGLEVENAKLREPLQQWLFRGSRWWLE